MAQPESVDVSLDSLRDFLMNQSLVHFSGSIDTAIDAISTLCDLLLGEKAWSWMEVAGLPTYTSTVSSVTLALTLVGSYGLGVWDPTEPIRLCIAGTPSEKTFFSLARTKFRRSEAVLTLLNSDRKTRRNFELAVNGHKFLVQYRQAPLIENSNRGAKPTFSSKGSPPTQLDTEYICQKLPDLEHREVFQKSYQLIKLWALYRGIYSPRFGYLGEDHLLQLVANVCQEHHTPAEVIIQFFAQYSTPDQDQGKKPFSAAQRTLPTFAAFESKGTVNAIRYHIHETQKLLSTEEWDWEKLLEGSSLDKSGVNSFLTSYDAYVQISAWYSGSSEVGAARFVEWLDSTVAKHAKAFHRDNEALKPRVWPVRFKDQRDQISEPSYTTFYLIGLHQGPSGIDAQLRDRIITMGDSIRKEDDRYSNTSFVETDLLSKQEMKNMSPNLVLDTERWPFLADDPNPEETSDEDSDDGAPSGPTYQTKQMKRDKAAKAKLAASQAALNTPTPPLRPAMDIYNRIKHDPSYPADNFVIGYTDRFAGILEMPLNWWAPEDKSSEKFIPQSRIRYFKRKIHNDYVWHRETKLDLIFGSGLSADSYAWKRRYQGVHNPEVPPLGRA